MKATQLLRMQHQDVEQLFDRLEGAGMAERISRRDDLAASLVGHSVVERELFYPACASTEGFADELREALEEHAIVEWTLQRLLTAAASDPSFMAKIVVLRDIFRRHVDDEEDEILPEAERSMGDTQLEELGTKMAIRFERAKASWEADLAAALGIQLQSLRSHKPTRATKRSRARTAPVRKRTAPAKRTARTKAKPRKSPASRTATTAKRKASAPKSRKRQGSRAKA